MSAVLAGTRGPSAPTQRSSEAATLSVADHGPLVPGPLGPLVPGRIDLRSLAEALERRWEADPQTGSFACPLPDHDGTALLATPPDDPDGDLRVLCCRGRWRSVGEVRAAEAYGADLLRSNIEIAVWTRRLAYEVGGFAPVEVRLPRLPEDAAQTTVLAREGFALLLGLRWADHESRPVAFSVRFCRAWCGLPSHRSAHEALRDLIETGIIQEAGVVGRVRLFLPARMLREIPPPGGGQPPMEPPPPPPTGPPEGDGADEHEFIARLIAEFDAEELPAAPESRPIGSPPVCAYERHRTLGLDWRAADGSGVPATCGVCHPPPDRDDFKFVRLAGDRRRR